MHDRRRYQRWNCSIPCNFELEGEILTGFVSNLSFNGACVEGLSDLPESGTEIILRLKGVSGQISMPAKVVYVVNEPDRERIGVQFDGAWEDKVTRLMPLFQEHISEEI